MSSAETATLNGRVPDGPIAGKLLAVLVAGAFIVIAVWAYMHQAGQVQL